jgi:hypothetical protein
LNFKIYAPTENECYDKSEEQAVGGENHKISEFQDRACLWNERVLEKEALHFITVLIVSLFCLK